MELNLQSPAWTIEGSNYIVVAKVAFRKCILNPPAERANTGCGPSRVVFDLDVDGQCYTNVYVEVHPSPAPETPNTPLEISELHGYNGPMNFEVLRGSIEFYARQILEGSSSKLHAEGSFLQLRDWTMEQDMVVQFEIPEDEE